VGGTTYAEAKAVKDFMDLNPNLRIVLGGTSIHNTRR